MESSFTHDTHYTVHRGYIKFVLDKSTILLWIFKCVYQNNDNLQMVKKNTWKTSRLVSIVFINVNSRDNYIFAKHGVLNKK